ncbi:MAG: 1-(5-phosphoribosyl)-5-[(5-phosphoribosylamino)methylideneamino]imidazole-4-carboxamide isomerase [Flavobacteriales bacterium]|nr:1-(5-phosphoribosyl)-5-[(5-phosphoribosylamino)methylideneamino]imidazole-4-carboxamide isomerase [Flavobacteriales bacterium]
MRIIPAIDLIDGKCVRLTKGDYNTKKIYNENPLEIAKEFEDNGIQYLHLVDLDGAKSKQIINNKTLELIAANTNLTIDFGGGLKSDEDVKIAFESGAHKITGGSIAASNPEIFMRWLTKYGSDKIILGADCKDRKIATNGWLKTLDIDVVDFINTYKQKGITDVICTDIAKDGMLQGTSNELYSEIIKKNTINLIASGGVSSIDDLIKVKEIGCEGAIVGKAIYEGKITLKELQELC